MSKKYRGKNCAYCGGIGLVERRETARRLLRAVLGCPRPSSLGRLAVGIRAHAKLPSSDLKVAAAIRIVRDSYLRLAVS